MDGGGGAQTVTQTQQIPEWEQQFAQGNQSIAQSIGAQPYPTYQGALQAPQNQLQQAGQAQAANASTSYQPTLNAGIGTTENALALNPGDPNQIAGYMSPYIQSALAPQVTALQTQLGQQQQGINAQATQANAFGDARQGTQSALANFYGNQNLVGLLGSGYNSAFQNAQNTLLGQQQAGLAGGAQLGNLAGEQQGLGVAGANAIYNAGSQQQQQQQTGLNLAYQQFQNQVNWPQQGLNIRESALSNSPYNTTNATTLPTANGTASSLGSFASLAGGLGSLLGGSGGAANNNAPFGGAAYKAG